MCKHKIHWVAWQEVCKEKSDGGLGIKNLRAFNLALLGKWLWRLRIEKTDLWYKVLVGRYGGVDGQVDASGQKGSRWWRDICSLEKPSADLQERWFSDAVCRKLGDGGDTCFWYDPWIPGGPLKDRFSRLFLIAENKKATVKERGWWDGGGAWKWGWAWRRQLFIWEGDPLAELYQLLEVVIFSLNDTDCWVWLEDTSGAYSVKSGYRLLQNSTLSQREPFYSQVWSKLVHSKVESFVWKLSLDRVPTLVSLASRGVVPRQDLLCIACTNMVETASHLFFECDFSYKVWMECLRWWGIHSAFLNECRGHFFQFVGLIGTHKNNLQLWKVVWFATI